VRTLLRSWFERRKRELGPIWPQLVIYSIVVGIVLLMSLSIVIVWMVAQ
jgi:hypothetical protein